MSKQTINIGASPNDGTGTPLRTSFDYTNQNFTELYTALGGGVGLPGATTQVIFNDGGTNLAGDAGLVYNKTTDTLTAGNADITGAATVGTTLGVTGVSTFSAGTAALPAITTTGDTNTGIYYPAADTFAVTTGGTERYRVNSSGNLLLSTADVAGRLQVAGSAVGAGIFSVDSDVTRVDIQAYNKPLSINRAGNDVNICESSGNVGVGTVAVNTGGCLQLKSGITFPATQVASSDANTLDDYEEGTWTPVATGLTAVGAVTYTAAYTKIGRVVYINLKISAVTSTTSVAGTTYLSGLPFAPAQNSTISSVNEGSIASVGVGLISTGSTVYTSNWTAVQIVTLSGFYYV